MATSTLDTQCLYRVLRPDENIQVGIYARAPIFSISVEDHVSNGSYNSSQYISTSKTLAAAQVFASITANKPSTSPNTMDNNTLYLYRVLRRDECRDEWSNPVGVEFFEEWSDERLKENLDEFSDEWNEENREQVIKAKDPESGITVEEHVSHGGRLGFKSKFISTAKTLNAARCFASKTVRKPVRIVEINIGSLLSSGENVQVIDLTNAGVVDNHISSVNMRARNFARKFEEVLIVGTIPYTYLGRVLEIQESGKMRWFDRNILDFNPRSLHNLNKD